MANGDIERFSAAAGTGELLVVTYAGGRAVGHKRRIVVRSVDEDADEMSVLENGQIRTYMLSKTVVVDENDSTPWMSDDMGKVVAVDPVAYFAYWYFTIWPESYGALGVFTRYVIDKEKTALARERAIAEGLARKDATRRVRIMKRETVINTPPVYGFDEGDIFYRGMFGGPDWVQVLRVRRSRVGAHVDVHFPWAGNFRISAEMFADFLKTGTPLDDTFLIRDTALVSE